MMYERIEGNPDNGVHPEYQRQIDFIRSMGNAFEMLYPEGRRDVFDNAFTSPRFAGETYGYLVLGRDESRIRDIVKWVPWDPKSRKHELPHPECLSDTNFHFNANELAFKVAREYLELWKRISAPEFNKHVRHFSGGHW